MWELDHKEAWVPKNWCFWIVVLEKTLESPLDKKEIKQSILKEISPEYYSFEGLMLKLQYFGPLMQSQLIGKDPDAGKDWRQEKGTKEDEMVGWHHWLSGQEFEQTLGDGTGQVSLACCSRRGCKESDTTEQLNNNNTSVCKYQSISETKAVEYSDTWSIEIHILPFWDISEKRTSQNSSLPRCCN